MTTPVPAPPSKLKAWVALAGSVLSFVVPFLVSVEHYLPSPWPAVIGGVIALLTAVGVYHAPYAPAGTVLVVPPEDASPSGPAAGPYGNGNPYA